MRAEKIIVIHPGSLNLRIGRASDLNPTTILHAIARKRLNTDKIEAWHRDKLITPVQEDALEEFEEQRLQVSHAIQEFAPKYEEKGAKRSRVVTPPQQIAAFNKRSRPEELPLNEEDEPDMKMIKNTNGLNNNNNDVLFDLELLQMPPEKVADYNVHFPMRFGELNLHNGIGGSMSAVLANLHAIWLYVIKNHMGIAPAALPQYSAVLVISDLYNRSHLREIMNLLLQNLRFGACFLLQDHVAATFGTGMGYGCVVDIGDQKCSVSCVEDGISQPDTRVRLGYGGRDITQVFYTLLKKCSFPYKECDPEGNYSDAALLIELKEKYCHIDLGVSGAQEKIFEVRKENKLLRYTIQLGDECIVAPLAFFYTELLNITGKAKLVRVQFGNSQQSDPEDCFDAEYIRETGRRGNGRDQLLEGSLPVTGDAGDDDLVVVDAYDVVERDSTVKNNDKDEQIYMPNGQTASLDQAIVRSIERCSSEEMKRKMYACIVLVGGSTKFPGFAKCLEKRIILQLASSMHHRSSDTPYEVNVFTKEMDPGMLSWKGAAIMSCLESAPELWITLPEWEKTGLRILREKAPFIW